jgi:hypothetical protein
LRPTPLGVSGELCIAGEGLARGYLGRPDLTAERFVPDPFGSEGGRLYRTGDVARQQPDGSLQVLGRIDRQIKIRGHRVEPGEIETLLREHEGIRDAAVVLREGSGGASLVAYVVMRGGREAPLGNVRDHVRRCVPEYMVPSKWVKLDELPLSAHGKLDRAALPDPDQSAADASAYAAPKNGAEETISRIWCEELRVERVGVRDNFFDVGGHSLLMARIHARLCKVFDREISMIELFRYPTVELLAKSLTQPEAGSDRGLDRAVKRAAQRRRRRAASEVLDG